MLAGYREGRHPGDPHLPVGGETQRTALLTADHLVNGFVRNSSAGTDGGMKVEF